MTTEGDSRDHVESDPAAAGGAVVDDLRAELDEARLIGRWLDDRSPALRLFPWDVSEWPWLVQPNPEDEAATPGLAEADRDRAVLRAFAVIQAAGGDPYDAEDVADTLGLSAEEFDGVLYRLIHAGLVTGGQLVSRSFVDTVTDQGMAAVGMLGAIEGADG